MNRILRLLVLLSFVFADQTMAQDSASHTIDWGFSGAKLNGDQYVIRLQGKIASGWKYFSIAMPDSLPNSRVLLDSASSLKIAAIEEKGNMQSAKEPLFDNAPIKYFEKEIDLLVTLQGRIAKPVKGVIQFMAIKGDSVAGPEAVPFVVSFDPSGNLLVKSLTLQVSTEAAQQLKRSSIDLHHPINPCGGTGVEGHSKSLWNIFLLGFLGGLIALLTPCVFPMIPLTVSFFTKQSKERKRGIGNASLYGFFILLIYTLLSLPFYFLDSLNPEILNNISTNVWLNIFFFVVFIVFALSFFGLFEITVPGSLANAVDTKAGAGSWVGIFFMALTLALVSFSCTGPILGSLLAGSLSTNGGAVQLTCGMVGFGLALALPFALFALFPGWLHSLPKSGGWLNTVKVVLGFLEIALAVKFLSNADLVEHWGILKREVFLGIWILTGIFLVLYLFGKIRFSHDPPPARLGIGRIVVAIFFLAFTAYLVPGLFKTKYANRSLVSGFPPPLSYSLYGDELIKLCGLEANVRNDYQAALQLAKLQHKPVMIDFTGWACVNCRKMEENVWTSPIIKELISKHFVLVSLYVDDRKLLPDDRQFIFQTRDGYKKEIKTIGDQFATLQSENFINASQPLYVLLSPDEKLLSFPVGYTPDVKEYAAWLRCGLDAYEKTKN
ncbi:MAG TPA: cytochrome c biogenesis protein CcdA [Puia sp.]|nr:cytochrome c biogenesis protein CcdA [Puia sp.]